jgi:hypothetical protein
MGLVCKPLAALYSRFVIVRLDKHGLVNRFAQILDTNGIDHMYSSTYKTANLLVSFRTLCDHAIRRRLTSFLPRSTKHMLLALQRSFGPHEKGIENTPYSLF